jgi:hypothetical protein
MKLITPKNVKVFSSAFHGLLAGAVVLVLLIMIPYVYAPDLFILWGAAVICACYFGWVLGSWYVPIKDERWFFEPYVVTPIISLLSAVVSGLLFISLTEVTASAQNMFNLGSVLGGGILIGLYAFVFTLPVTAIVGIAVALYLYKFGGYKNVL